LGQNTSEQDSLAIVSFADKIIIKVNMDTQTDAYTLRVDGNDADFKLASNNNYRLFYHSIMSLLVSVMDFRLNFLQGIMTMT
jgi:hypothetical protein